MSHAPHSGLSPTRWWPDTLSLTQALFKQPKARRVVKSFSLDPRLALRLETFPNQSEVVKKALETWLYYYSLEDGELRLRDGENYVFLAKTRWGKTTLVKRLIAASNNPKLIVDPHGEYDSGEIVETSYYERIPLIGDEMYRLVKSTMWSRVDNVLENLTDGSTVLRLGFTDLEAERIFVSELLRALLQKHIHSKERRLVVVEESQRYADGLIPLVSQGLKNGLQTIALSQFPLPSEAMLNATPVLGYLWKNIVQQTSLPPEVADMLTFLKRHEFVYYDSQAERWLKTGEGSED